MMNIKEKVYLDSLIKIFRKTEPERKSFKITYDSEEDEMLYRLKKRKREFAKLITPFEFQSFIDRFEHESSFVDVMTDRVDFFYLAGLYHLFKDDGEIIDRVLYGLYRYLKKHYHASHIFFISFFNMPAEEMPNALYVALIIKSRRVNPSERLFIYKNTYPIYKNNDPFSSFYLSEKENGVKQIAFFITYTEYFYKIFSEFDFVKIPRPRTRKNEVYVLVPEELYRMQFNELVIVPENLIFDFKNVKFLFDVRFEFSKEAIYRAKNKLIEFLNLKKRYASFFNLIKVLQREYDIEVINQFFIPSLFLENSYIKSLFFDYSIDDKPSEFFPAGLDIVSSESLFTLYNLSEMRDNQIKLLLAFRIFLYLQKNQNILLESLQDEKVVEGIIESLLKDEVNRKWKI